MCALATCVSHGGPPKVGFFLAPPPRRPAWLARVGDTGRHPVHTRGVGGGGKLSAANLPPHHNPPPSYCGPGWTDKADRPGLDAVDEACHQHDSCYGAAWAGSAPKSKERAKAECACDRTLVKTLSSLKKDAPAFAAISADGRRVADDIIKAMPVKCSAELLGGIFLPHKKAPPPADGGDGSSTSVMG